jgi:hypothetical protein
VPALLGHAGAVVAACSLACVHSVAALVSLPNTPHLTTPPHAMMRPLCLLCPLCRRLRGRGLSRGGGGRARRAGAGQEGRQARQRRRHCEGQPGEGAAREAQRMVSERVGGCRLWLQAVPFCHDCQRGHPVGTAVAAAAAAAPSAAAPSSCNARHPHAASPPPASALPACPPACSFEELAKLCDPSGKITRTDRISIVQGGWAQRCSRLRGCCCWGCSGSKWVCGEVMTCRRCDSGCSCTTAVSSTARGSLLAPH